MDAFQVIKDDDTLPDDAWKDSFDKLLDNRSALRDMNMIKRDIRASVNMNSSYENSCCDDLSRETSRGSHQRNIIATQKKGLLDVPNITLYKAIRTRTDSILSVSTPLRIRETVNPFKCTLSPIVNLDSNRESVAAVSKSPMPLAIKIFKPRRNRKQVCFNTLIKFDDTPVTNGNCVGRSKRPVSLQPGKWRKSLNLWRRTQSTPMENPQSPNTEYEYVTQNSDPKALFVIDSKTSLNTFAASHRKSMFNRKYLSLTNNVNDNNFEYELMRRCGQNKALLFEDAYSESYLQKCCKIGEGAFGEVFIHNKSNGKKEENTVLKIIPIEGKDLVNGETQKTFEQILQEVVICMELCALNNKSGKSNFSPGFVNLEKVRCVTGQYPVQLQKLWEEYDDKKESENDHPECFNGDQLFVVLEMAFSGEDMECFVFQNAVQSFYALHQIIYTLAVGEEVFQFEHRDLHWGNILFLKTKNKYISYKLGGKILTLPTKGIRITIIDYTLSRITYNNGCYYNDLSCDPELFTATGDYQFDIYRMMREALNDNWEKFEPKTNIFWTSYIISKMLKGVSYSKSQQKVHLQYMDKLNDLNSSILTYKSCRDCAMDLNSKLK